MSGVEAGKEDGLLFVGDDWSQARHDVEVQDEAGRRLGRARLAEGVAGIARLHELIAEQLGEDEGPGQVVVGIETGRGPWVAALIAAGYQVYAINPLQVARYRERHSVSGAKSDTADAHTLADMVRTDRHQLRPVADDTDAAEAIKVVARAHQQLIWERTRHLLRLRSTLREFFPAALLAFGEDLASADALELLAAAPDPVSAARLSTSRISAALTRARRRQVPDKAERIAAALRTKQLSQPEVLTTAYAATVRAQTAILTTLQAQIKTMQEQIEAHFGRHPDAEIYLSQPGLGTILGARVLAEFGDDPHRYAGARARKNYADTTPDHPPIRQEKNRARPARPQRPAPRRAGLPGPISTEHLTRRPSLRRPATPPRSRTLRRATSAGQPPRRHPARLPENPHLLRRGHRLTHHQRRSTSRSLTNKALGCLSSLRSYTVDLTVPPRASLRPVILVSSPSTCPLS
jgi:transposase